MNGPAPGVTNVGVRSSRRSMPVSNVNAGVVKPYSAERKNR